jgi:hypothetical protein
MIIILAYIGTFDNLCSIVISNQHFLLLQVEIFNGRGKPPTLVDKDEGLGKVKRLI